MDKALSIVAPIPSLEAGETSLPQIDGSTRKPPVRASHIEPLLTAEEVAELLNVSTDWVWDHSSRRKPYLPVIRMGDGALRYRPSGIEEFVNERERMSALRRRA